MRDIDLDMSDVFETTEEPKLENPLTKVTDFLFAKSLTLLRKDLLFVDDIDSLASPQESRTEGLSDEFVEGLLVVSITTMDGLLGPTSMDVIDM